MLLLLLLALLAAVAAAAPSVTVCEFHQRTLNVLTALPKSEPAVANSIWQRFRLAVIDVVFDQPLFVTSSATASARFNHSHHDNGLDGAARYEPLRSCACADSIALACPGRAAIAFRSSWPREFWEHPELLLLPTHSSSNALSAAFDLFHHYRFACLDRCPAFHRLRDSAPMARLIHRMLTRMCYH